MQWLVFFLDRPPRLLVVCPRWRVHLSVLGNAPLPFFVENVELLTGGRFE